MQDIHLSRHPKRYQCICGPPVIYIDRNSSNRSHTDLLSHLDVSSVVLYDNAVTPTRVHSNLQRLGRGSCNISTIWQEIIWFTLFLSNPWNCDNLHLNALDDNTKYHTIPCIDPHAAIAFEQQHLHLSPCFLKWRQISIYNQTATSTITLLHWPASLLFQAAYSVFW